MISLTRLTMSSSLLLITSSALMDDTGFQIPLLLYSTINPERQL